MPNSVLLNGLLFCYHKRSMEPRQTDRQLPYQPNPQPLNPVITSQGEYATVPPIAASPSTTGHNPYEFILNAQQPKSASLGRNALLKRILLVCSGLALLAIVVAIAMSFLAPKGVSTEQLLSVAQQQQEIVRVAQTASSQASSQKTKDIAATVQLSIGSNQQQLLQYAEKASIKIDKKQLELKKDSKTDAFLENAQATSTYDAAWRQTMLTLLASYKTSLSTLFTSTSSPSLKSTLNNSFNGVNLLEEQLRSPN